MEKLKIIFNGNPDTGSGNINRARIALVTPLLLGLAGATYQSVISPELGIIPPLVTMLVPAVIGITEMFRQFRISNKKNAKIDKTFYVNNSATAKTENENRSIWPEGATEYDRNMAGHLYYSLREKGVSPKDAQNAVSKLVDKVAEERREKNK